MKQTKVEKDCTHIWLIETPTGPYSKGRCGDCNAVKDFDNHCDVDSTKSRLEANGDDTKIWGIWNPKPNRA